MQQARKRRVRTCYPCYTRKQKCNRQYPCNHCTRRQRPEECVYSSPPAVISRAAAPVHGDGRPLRDTPAVHESGGHWSTQHSSLTKSFGYFEESSSNTMALLRRLELPGEGESDLTDPLLSIWDTIQRELGRIPDRQILDFLVQHFVYELNWMKQVVHAPSFLTSYQQWWAKDEPGSVTSVEFAALVLRICSYTTQFLPLPSHPFDQICGQSLSDICDTCSDTGRNLAKACETLDWKGSLFRVQHIMFAALKVSCEGRTDQFWEGIASASRAAQKAGIHMDATGVGQDSAKELEREVRRRTFCSLYILDSHLSRQLDRVPFLPDHLVAETLPRLHLIPNIGNLPADTVASAPDIFTERLMQVQLGRFWRSFGLRKNFKDDPTECEQRYEKFCTEWIPSLHAAFAIDHPDMTWDDALPKLPMQRQLLHITVFDSVCWNFRPLLFLKPSYIASLAPYKQVLLQSQKRRIGMAALKELEAVATLHSMFGGSYTRFAAIIFNTFEAATLLLCLCSHADFPFDLGDDHTDILGIKVKFTYRKAMQAAEQAVNRLQMLAELSNMAASGARVAAQLFAKAARVKQSPSPVAPAGSDTGSLGAPPYPTTMGIDEDQEQWPSLDHTDPVLMTDIFSSMVHENADPKPPLSSLEFPTLWGAGH